MIIIIDNYDSFTYNLAQLVGAQAGPGQQLRVIRNDACDPAELAALGPSHVLLSPGPGHPSAAGLSLAASDAFPDTPLLGVCLGHQALAVAHGASVGRSPRPTHGRAVTIRHDGASLFEGLPPRFGAALYHSLVVEPASLRPPLAACAWTDSGDIMALRHETRPHYGVQFHPESFMTDAGARMVRNFLHS